MARMCKFDRVTLTVLYVVGFLAALVGMILAANEHRLFISLFEFMGVISLYVTFPFARKGWSDN